MLSSPFLRRNHTQVCSETGEQVTGGLAHLINLEVPKLVSWTVLEPKNTLRTALEDAKAALGRQSSDKSIYGMDRRVAVEIIAARPDMENLAIDDVILLVGVTLDSLLYDAFEAAGVDPRRIQYEFVAEVGEETLSITGDCEYRVRVERPQNKLQLQKAIKREVTLALHKLFEMRHVPVPSEFINRVTDSIGQGSTRFFLDVRLSEAIVKDAARVLKLRRLSG